jgi:hypothetical protein
VLTRAVRGVRTRSLPPHATALLCGFERAVGEIHAPAAWLTRDAGANAEASYVGDMISPDMKMGSCPAATGPETSIRDAPTVSSAHGARCRARCWRVCRDAASSRNPRPALIDPFGLGETDPRRLPWIDRGRRLRSAPRDSGRGPATRGGHHGRGLRVAAYRDSAVGSGLQPYSRRSHERCRSRLSYLI